MQNRDPYRDITNLFTIPSTVGIEGFLLLPGNRIAIEEFYGDLLQSRIVIYDLKTLKPIVTLLPSQYYVTSKALIGKQNLAITFYSPDNESDHSHHLGIWDLQQISEDFIEPIHQFAIKKSQYWPRLASLPNDEIVYAEIPGNNIEFYDKKGHIATLNDEKGFDHKLFFATTEKELIKAAVVPSDLYSQDIEITIIDLKTKKNKANFFLHQGSWVAQPQNILILQNKYLALTTISISPYPSEKNPDLLQKNQIGIWDLDTQKKVRTLEAKGDIEKLIALASEDFVSITKNGCIEYWNGTTFEKYAYFVELALESLSNTFDVIALENHALLVLLTSKEQRVLYIPAPEKYLINQNEIVQTAVDIVAPDAKIPEINQIVRSYLGFFTPKKLASPILESCQAIDPHP